VSDQVSHTYKTTSKITYSFITSWEILCCYT
jgi:hypothetical protein